ncbi:hypothetical protein RB601_004871 [Gaeumannomyces tritici]
MATITATVTAISTEPSPASSSSTTGNTVTTMAASNNNNNTTDTDSPVTALMRTALDALGSRSRSVAASLRLQRDIIVDGWADRLGDLAERYAEDKRQARAHARRARHSLADRLGRRGRDREERAFPQFARLPAEIRLQIWEEALPGARAVMLRGPWGAPGGTLRDELKFVLPRLVRGGRRGSLGGGGGGPRSGADDDFDNDDGRRTLAGGWTSSTPPPAMLHACSESRAVALRRYSLVFATTDDDDDDDSGSSSSSGRIYADLTSDVVCLSSGEVSGAGRSALWRRTRDLGRVRHLAVAAPAWSGYPRPHRGSAGAGGSTSFAHRLPPADLMGRAGLAALEDVVVVRSVRWRYGRLPRGARVDFAAWAEREEAGEGLSRYHTRWRDGVMAIRHGRRKSSETVAEDRAAMGS